MKNKFFLFLLVNSAYAHGGEQMILSFLVQISLMFIFFFWIAASSRKFKEKLKPMLIILLGIPFLNMLLFIPEFLGFKMSLNVFLWIMPVSLILGYVSLRMLYKIPLLKAIKENFLNIK